MDSQLFLLIINFLILFIITIKYIIKKKRSQTGSLTLFLYTFSAFCAIIYYCNPYFIQNKELTILPFIYWLIAFRILCIPLFKYDSLNIIGIKYNIKVINSLCVISLFISIIPFIEQFVQIPTLFNATQSLSDTFSDIHDESNKQINFSLVGKFLQRVVWALYDLMFLFILPVIRSKKVNKLALLGIIMVIITRNLEFFLLASRNGLLRMILQLVLAFIILYPLMTAFEKKKVIRIMTLLITAIIGVFTLITIARQIGYSEKNEEYTMLYFLSRYAGEGMINFNQYIFDIKNYTNGDYTLWTFKNLLGFDVPPLTRDYLYGHIQTTTGIPMMVFYTFIGFIVIDLGPIATLFIFIIVAIMLYRLLSFNQKYIPISTLFIFFIFTSTIINGTCVYQYSGKSSEYFWLYLTIFIFLRWKKM